MLFEVLILLFCLYLVIRGPSSLSLHTSGGTGTVPGESFSLDCPGFPAALKLDKKKTPPQNKKQNSTPLCTRTTKPLLFLIELERKLWRDPTSYRSLLLLLWYNGWQELYLQWREDKAAFLSKVILQISRLSSSFYSIQFKRLHWHESFKHKGYTVQ